LIKTGEDKWYTALKKESQYNNFSTKLAQILLTHRPTDYLLLILDDKDIVLGMCWGRKFAQILHLDRLFVFPKYRRNGIASFVIIFFVHHFDQVIWRAVHDAMDIIAMNLKGHKETIDGYNGWVIDRKNLNNGHLTELSKISSCIICTKCEKEAPFGNYCVYCGINLLENGLKR
jgi:hypothetical protein